MKKKLFFLSSLLFSVLLFGQSLSQNTTASFIFTPQAPLNRPPIEVFYHIPKGDITKMPILMSFHGEGRDGANHRNYWINMANANGFMVFAPEFSEANYPGIGDNYIMSNIFDDGDNPSQATFNNQNEWTCSILDPLFDFIKSKNSGSQQKYSAWGHSAGAQFLHRFFMYLPNSKIDIAVCSNAGWYTVPENTVRFPYGILNGQLPNSDLTTAFSKKLVVHLGKDDTVLSTSSGGPRSNSTVNNQQGLTRLARGQYFFNTSKNTAQNMAVIFNWEKQEVAGIGHNTQLMANDALRYLLPSLLSTGTIDFDKTISIYPNPTSSNYVNVLSSADIALHISVYDIIGNRVHNETISNNQLELPDIKPGVYILEIRSNNSKTGKKLIIK